MKKSKIVMVLLVLMFSGFVFAEESPAYRAESTMVSVKSVEEDWKTTRSILKLNEIGYMLQGRMMNFIKGLVQMSHNIYR